MEQQPATSSQKDIVKNLTRHKNNVRSLSSTIIGLIKKICRQVTAKAVHHDNVFSGGRATTHISSQNPNQIMVSMAGAQAFKTLVEIASQIDDSKKVINLKDRISSFIKETQESLSAR